MPTTTAAVHSGFVSPSARRYTTPSTANATSSVTTTATPLPRSTAARCSAAAPASVMHAPNSTHAIPHSAVEHTRRTIGRVLGRSDTPRGYPFPRM